MKIEQRKVQGPELEPRVKQPSWLAQFTEGRVRGKRKKYIKGGGRGLLFLSCLLGRPALKDYFPLLSK